MIVFSDPIKRMADCAERLWPDLSCTVVWVSGMYDTEGAWGMTSWAPDPADDPEGLWPANVSVMVQTDSMVPMQGMPDVLAHELAHVAAGMDADHGPEWERCYRALQAEWFASQGYEPDDEQKAELDALIECARTGKPYEPTP